MPAGASVVRRWIANNDLVAAAAIFNDSSREEIISDDAGSMLALRGSGTTEVDSKKYRTAVRHASHRETVAASPRCQLRAAVCANASTAANNRHVQLIC